MNPDLYGESFNIGTGVKTTIADLADAGAGGVRHPRGAALQHDGRPRLGPPGLVCRPVEGEAAPRMGAVDRARRRAAGHGEVDRLAVRCADGGGDEEGPERAPSQRVGHRRLLQRRAGDPRDARAADATCFASSTSTTNHLRQRREPRRQRRRDPRVERRATRTSSGISHSRNFGSQMAFRCGDGAVDEGRRRPARRRPAGSAGTDRAVLRTMGGGFRRRLRSSHQARDAVGDGAGLSARSIESSRASATCRFRATPATSR